MRRNKTFALLAALLLLLGGCGGGAPAASSAQPASRQVGEIEDSTVPATSFSDDEDFEPYEAPEFADSAFHADLAEGDGGGLIDLSAVEDGVVAVSAESDSRLKFQVLKDDITYNYDIASDGTPSVFPLQSGDGSYRFRVMENVSESKYAEMCSATQDVTLSDEFEPFLRPNDYVNYTKDSECVKKAEELAETVPDALGVVSAVYEYVCATVTYDHEKAESVQSGYMPDPDETMSTGEGICFDYASLAAAMLRSQGIPTKVIFGYVSPDDLYHAWNMFYTDETGWVTVSYEVSKDTWNRLDLTFSANGADSTFIGDGGNYADLYFY